MKYIISEGIVSEEKRFNAFGKARGDANSILTSKGFKFLDIPTKSGVEKNKLKKYKQYIQYIKNSSIWKKELKKLNQDDYVLIQYPIINNCLFLPNIIKKYSKKINFILLIHDLDSIRFKEASDRSFLYKRRVKSEDTKLCIYSKYIISHNESMTKELIDNGVNKDKIINLGLFDYLDKKNVKAKIDYNSGVIIAGNLSTKKAKYLGKLGSLKGTNFNLYGINFDENCISDNINYKGAFSPEELLENLEGSYGLVWDGDSIDQCDGAWGNYLKYNDPHKASLYLSTGLPIVVWKKSALAKFVEENKVGIAVNSLDEIKTVTKKISKSEYTEMSNNVWKISQKLKKGYFLSTAIDKIFKK